MRVAALGAPSGLGALLDGAPLRTRLRGSFEVVLLFSTSRARLARRLDAGVAALAPRGALWLAWPKRSSGLSTDLDDRAVRALGLATGLVDNRVCAIDATWSALRFVHRRTGR